MSDPDPLEALRPDERDRLDRFARAFDELPADAYPRFADLTVADEMRAAQQRAIRLMGDGPRSLAIQAAVDAFIDAGTDAFSRLPVLPRGVLISQARLGRIDDRDRFLATIDRAVVAVILWDQLSPLDRGRLVGPWADLVESTLEG